MWVLPFGNLALMAIWYVISHNFFGQNISLFVKKVFITFSEIYCSDFMHTILSFIDYTNFDGKPFSQINNIIVNIGFLTINQTILKTPIVFNIL